MLVFLTEMVIRLWSHTQYTEYFVTCSHDIIWHITSKTHNKLLLLRICLVIKKKSIDRLTCKYFLFSYLLTYPNRTTIMVSQNDKNKNIHQRTNSEKKTSSILNSNSRCAKIYFETVEIDSKPKKKKILY